MNRGMFWLMEGFAFSLTMGLSFGAADYDPPNKPISWKSCLSQKADWYGSEEAVRIADNVLLYQRTSGGWPKNIDMARVLNENEKSDLRQSKNSADSTIDNGATFTQLRYLALVFNATPLERFKNATLAGIDYLFAAQYPNGGWPQFFPNPTGYHRYITFNDDAMIGVMRLLRDTAQGKAPFGFVDSPRREKADKAVQKGIECILKCQIVVDGKRLAWCAQHDDQTFEPRPARSYEKASLSGSEAVGVVDFLMEIEKPSPEVIEAVQSAVAWFDRVKLTGIRQVQKPDPSSPRGWDKVIVEDPNGPPLWARFYEIGADRPIFCSRDGIIRYRLADISYERRNGYSWYSDRPGDMLNQRYPAWQKKWAVDRNVLNK